MIIEQFELEGITVKLYKTAVELTSDLCGVPFSDCFEVVGTAADGDVIRLSPEEYIASLEHMGCHGYAEVQKNEVHIWVRDDVKFEMLLRLLAHERGHLDAYQLDPEKSDITDPSISIQEGFASTCDVVAVWAYQMAKQIQEWLETEKQDKRSE